MELSSPELIRAMALSPGNYAGIKNHRVPSSVVLPGRKAAAKRCKCGHCRQCLDDARWERIFATKFVDPNYYTRSAVRRSSPLTSL